jgi:hypothetical protein
MHYDQETLQVTLAVVDLTLQTVFKMKAVHSLTPGMWILITSVHIRLKYFA